MTDDKYATLIAHTQHDEAILFKRALLIVELNRILIEKQRLRLREGNPMLFAICTFLGFIPFASNRAGFLFML